jgi:hypothetical protein
VAESLAGQRRLHYQHEAQEPVGTVYLGFEVFGDGLGFTVRLHARVYEGVLVCSSQAVDQPLETAGSPTEALSEALVRFRNWRKTYLLAAGYGASFEDVAAAFRD